MGKSDDNNPILQECTDTQTDNYLDNWSKKLQKENLNILIKQFEDERLEEVESVIESAEKLRAEFVCDYPVEKIMVMSLEEYMVAPKG